MKKIYLLLIALTFTTVGFGQTPIISQDLRTGSIPAGWAQSAVTFTTSAGGYANFTTTSAILTTPTFNASAYTSLRVDTSVAKFGTGTDGPITIEYSLNGGTTWTTAGTTSTPTSSTYIDDQLPISSVSSTMKIRFSRAASPSQKRFRDVVINGVGTASCTAPTGQATSYSTTAITSSTSTLNWARGNGDNVLVVMRQGGAVNADPSNGSGYTANSAFGSGDQIGTGNYVVYNGPLTSVNVTSLSQNTNYHVAIYEYTSGTNCYRKIDKLTGNFNTLCTAVSSLPFTEDFEGGVVPPACWTTFRGTNNLGVVEDWKISAAGEGLSSSLAARVNPENIAPSISEDWLVTPALDLSLTVNNQLTFYAKDFLVADQGSSYTIRVSTTSQTSIGSFATVQTYDETALGNSYNQKTIDLTAYDGQSTVYIAFVMEQSNGDVFFLDDVEVSGDCAFPSGQATSFSATSIDADAGTATLNWTRGTGNNVLVVMKEASATIEDPTSGLTYAANSVFGSGDEIGTGNFVVYNGPATSVNISNLMQNTTYDVSIYEYNNTADCYNLTQLTGSFNVPCASFGLPFSEGFEGGTIPACWTSFENNGFGTENWKVDSAEPNTGTYSARMQFEFGTTPAGVSENWLVTPAIDLTSALYGELSFFSKDGDDSEDYGTVYTVRVSTMSQTTPGDFTTAVTYDEIELGSVYNQKTINLNAYVGNVIYIAFVKEQDVDLGGDDWYLDDVSVTVPVFPTRTFWYEPFTNNSQYDVTTGGEGNDGNADYFQITNGSNINKSYTGNTGNFFAAQDIDDGGWAGSASPSVLEWTGINVSRYSSLNFSGKFASSATDKIDNSDFVIVEYQLDGGGWNNLIAFENDGSTFNSFFQEDTDFDGTGDGTHLTSAFQIFSKSIATIGSVLDLRITIAVDSGDEDIALEDFRLVGVGTGFEANDAVGFGGPVGLGTMEILASQAPNIEFKFNKGGADFNNHLVIYIDSKAGGITSTSGLTDTGDPGRKALSGLDGGNRATLNFPPGFSPDYAISMDNGFAGLYEIVVGGTHTFIRSANLSPTGTNAAATYSFNIPFTDIMTSPGLEGFKFLATYINGTNAFRSNESFGRNTAGATNPGVPSTMTFETYFQVSSGLQGGIAPTIATGPWSADTVWLNGNPPLETDQITVNQDVDQNIDVVALNGVTINAALDILDTYTLTTAGGLTGTGTLDVSGKLSITEGGYTDIAPTYNSGSTLEYKDITTVYNRYNEWNLGAEPENVIIDNADLNMTNPSINPTLTEDFNVGNDMTLLNGATLTVDPVKSVTVGNNFNNDGGTVSLNSNATRYSSLIANSVTGSGTFEYDRHINGQTGVGVGSGGNDLVSAPFSGQSFSDFRAANPNIRNNGNADPLLALYLFGPFEKSSGTYLTWAGNNSTDLAPAVGYRAASTDNGNFTFSGAMTTDNEDIGITTSGPSFIEWNLIGNPYPSYIKLSDFLAANSSKFHASRGGVYGYNGDSGGYEIWNDVYSMANPNAVIAPGQGFMVASNSPAVDVNFTPGMRSVGTADDFIPLRMTNESLAYLRLNANISAKDYTTDFYFTDLASRGLNPGFDSGVFGSGANGIYSELVEENSGIDMGIQSIPYSDLGSEVRIPVGIKATQGEQITVSMVNANLPDGIAVFFEDQLTNTFTQLNSSAYVFTANSNLSDIGRFYLRFNDNTLSNGTADLDGLQIYSLEKTVHINGLLSAATTVNLFDIQGRKVLSSSLESGSSNNTIDVSGLSTGVYVVKLSNTTQEKTQRVIIK